MTEGIVSAGGFLYCASARIEHDEWMGDKIRHGWTFGPTRDKAKRKNPFIIVYESLAEKEKELDRNAIRKMPDVVAACGYAIFPDTKKTRTS